jgi:hypothetical protein
MKKIEKNIFCVAVESTAFSWEQSFSSVFKRNKKLPPENS